VLDNNITIVALWCNISHEKVLAVHCKLHVDSHRHSTVQMYLLAGAYYRYILWM